MGNGAVDSLKDTAEYFTGFGSGGAELLRQEAVGLPWVHRVSAGEQVDGGVSVLGPRVDREMAFRYDHDAAHPMRAESMECALNDCGSTQ